MKKAALFPALGAIILGVAFGVQLYSDRQSSHTTSAERLTANTQQRSTAFSIRRKPNKIDQFYDDDFGNQPIAQEFDAAPGALCGNGQSWYHTSIPPKKPIPLGWKPPPPIGGTENYQGPDPLAPIKESPYAMPAARQVFRAPAVDNKPDIHFIRQIDAVLKNSSNVAAYISHAPAAAWLQKAAPAMKEKKATQIFLSLSPEAAYRSLTQAGVTHVIVDRFSPKPAPWIESSYTPAAIRLRDNLPNHFFRPLVIGRNYLLYSLQHTPPLKRSEMQHLTSYIRMKLQGKSAAFPGIQTPLQPVDGDTYRVIVSLRARQFPEIQGRKVAKKIGRGNSLQSALDTSVERLRQGWQQSRTSVASLFGKELPDSIEAAIELLEIEIDMFTDMSVLTDRSTRRLSITTEIGVDGLTVHTGGKLYYLEPSYALQREQKTPYQFLLRLLKKSRLEQYLSKAKDEKLKIAPLWFHDPALTFGTFRTANWIENRPGEDIVQLYRGFPFVPSETVSQSTLQAAIRSGASWLVRHQSPDGQYGYKYAPLAPAGKRWTPGGNIVRHGLNPYTLLLANAATPDPTFVQSARAGIDFSLQFLRKEGARCVICHRDIPAAYYNAKLGAVAVSILSILKLAEIEDISSYSEALNCLAEEVLFMQDPNGHFRQYDVPIEHPYYGAESTIPPGQLLMVLARLHAHTHDERFLDAAHRALDYYMKAWRHLVQKQTTDGVYIDEDRANIIGIIPWMIMALNDLHQLNPQQQYADMAFEMQDWIIEHIFYSKTRAPFPDYSGAAFKSHSELPAINACQFTEGATALHSIARRINKRVKNTAEAALLGARFCLQLQFTDDRSTFFIPEPDSVLGGFRYHLGHTRLRNDYSYHALASLSQALLYISAEYFPTESN